jgi:DNA-binding MarR family transcriptional regulator
MNKRLKCGFGQVSNTVLRDPEVSLGEKALYSYLCTYADRNNELYVSVNKMASELGMGVSTVKRYIAKLEKKQVIKRISRGELNSKLTILLK